MSFALPHFTTGRVCHRRRRALGRRARATSSTPSRQLAAARTRGRRGQLLAPQYKDDTRLRACSTWTSTKVTARSADGASRSSQGSLRGRRPTSTTSTRSSTTIGIENIRWAESLPAGPQSPRLGQVRSAGRVPEAGAFKTWFSVHPRSTAKSRLFGQRSRTAEDASEAWHRYARAAPGRVHARHRETSSWPSLDAQHADRHQRSAEQSRLVPRPC